MKIRIGSLLAAMALCATSAFATSITIGATTGPNNFFPFGCGPTCGPQYVGEYQQIYAASAFGGPITIRQVAFETVRSGSLSSNFALSLGTTAATPASPGSNYAANKRPDLTAVFTGTIVVPSPGSGTFDFIINLTTPFTYNPAVGNLLLDVNIIADTGDTAFIAGDSTDTGRVFNFGGTGAATGGANYGLLTRFSDVAVPEPASLTLLASGLAVAARRWRHRRRP